MLGVPGWPSSGPTTNLFHPGGSGYKGFNNSSASHKELDDANIYFIHLILKLGLVHIRLAAWQGLILLIAAFNNKKSDATAGKLLEMTSAYTKHQIYWTIEQQLIIYCLYSLKSVCSSSRQG